MVDNQGRAVRGLPFPLKNPQNSSVVPTDGEVTNLTPSFFPEDGDERIDVKFNLSLNEFVTLASAIDIASDIGWSEERTAVWWIWVRSLIGEAMTCEDIIGCIETDPDVMAAVTQSLIGQGLVDPNTVDPETTTIPQRFAARAMSLSDEIGTLEDCNLDVLWGAIRHGIVLYLDDNARNFLEDLNSQADIAQRYASGLNAIPVIGDLLADTALGFIEVIPDLLNLFNAYSSETVMDEIACDLFEMVCTECRFPTWEELFGYYASQGMDGMDDVNELALSAATMLITGSTEFAATLCYHTIIAYELFVLFLAAKFNQAIGTNAIQIWAAVGEDFESDNWIDLCDGCEPDLFAPVITRNVPCSVAASASGSIVGQQSTWVWRLSSTLYTEAGVQGISFADTEQKLFRIAAVSKVSGADIHAWTMADNACATSNGFGNSFVGNNIKNIVVIAASNTAFTYDFTFELP